MILFDIYLRHIILPLLYQYNISTPLKCSFEINSTCINTSQTFRTNCSLLIALGKGTGMSIGYIFKHCTIRIFKILTFFVCVHNAIIKVHMSKIGMQTFHFTLKHMLFSSSILLLKFVYHYLPPELIQLLQHQVTVMYWDPLKDL